MGLIQECILIFNSPGTNHAIFVSKNRSQCQVKLRNSARREPPIESLRVERQGRHPGTGNKRSGRARYRRHGFIQAPCGHDGAGGAIGRWVGAGSFAG